MSKGLYPIRTISAMTGVNPVTLRAWERRHGLIRPQRTPKGHRLYTEEDIQRIRHILTLLDRGIPISQARQALDTGRETPPLDAEPETGTASDAWEPLLDGLLRAAEHLDEDALDANLEQALSLFPAHQIRHNLLEPLYHQAVDAEETPEAGDTGRALIRGWLTTILAARLRHAGRPATGARLLLAHTAADTVPALLIACEARDRGWRVTCLPATDDAQALAQAGAMLGASALVCVGESGILADAIRSTREFPADAVFRAIEPGESAAEAICLGQEARSVLQALDEHGAGTEPAV